MIDYTNWLENPYVSGALCIFLIAYAGMVAPKPPQIIAQFFDNTFFQLLYMFVLVFLAKRNATVALIAAIAFLVSIMALNRIKISNEMMSVVGKQNDNTKWRRSLKCYCFDDRSSSGMMPPMGPPSRIPGRPRQSEEGMIAEEIRRCAESERTPMTPSGRQKSEEVSRAEEAGVITRSEAEKLRKKKYQNKNLIVVKKQDLDNAQKIVKFVQKNLMLWLKKPLEENKKRVQLAEVLHYAKKN